MLYSNENELQIHTAWINLTNIMLSERGKKDAFHSQLLLRMKKSDDGDMSCNLLSVLF